MNGLAGSVTQVKDDLRGFLLSSTFSFEFLSFKADPAGLRSGTGVGRNLDPGMDMMSSTTL